MTAVITLSASMSILPSCSPDVDPDALPKLDTTTLDDWQGRWEDGTGYWLHITVSDGVPGLLRSGSDQREDQLEVVAFEPAEAVLTYRESGYYPRDFANPTGPVEYGPMYVHTLEMVGRGVMRDRWEPVGVMQSRFSPMTQLLRRQR